MWSKIAELPPHFVGQQVLSMLECKDIVHLDSAVVGETSRAILYEWFDFSSIGIFMWQVASCARINVLRWCIGRKIRLRWMTLSTDFSEAFSLLVANPRALEGHLISS
jgi:hypothetical protein